MFRPFTLREFFLSSHTHARAQFCFLVFTVSNVAFGFVLVSFIFHLYFISYFNSACSVLSNVAVDSLRKIPNLTIPC